MTLRASSVAKHGPQCAHHIAKIHHCLGVRDRAQATGSFLFLVDSSPFNRENQDCRWNGYEVLVEAALCRRFSSAETSARVTDGFFAAISRKIVGSLKRIVAYSPRSSLLFL